MTALSWVLLAFVPFTFAVGYVVGWCVKRDTDQMEHGLHEGRCHWYPSSRLLP